MTSIKKDTILIKSDSIYLRHFKEGPTHHWALSVGHNARLFSKVAKLMAIECVEI